MVVLLSHVPMFFTFFSTSLSSLTAFKVWPFARVVRVYCAFCFVMYFTNRYVSGRCGQGGGNTDGRNGERS